MSEDIYAPVRDVVQGNQNIPTRTVTPTERVINVRTGILDRQINNRQIADNVNSTSEILNQTAPTRSVSLNSNSQTVAPSPLTNFDPFFTLADIYRNVFGPSQGISSAPSNIVAVPVGDETGSDFSILPIVLILAAGGFGIYWFYFRK